MPSKRPFGRSSSKNTLMPADTWEVALSAGKDKRENFERLQLAGAAEKFAAPLFLVKNNSRLVSLGAESAARWRCVRLAVGDRTGGT